MDSERAREFLLALPLVEETLQWGNNLVFWVGDKAIGGKMFALMNLDNDGKGVLSFAAGPDGFAELTECEGILPAPYFARLHWVTLERWDALRDGELKDRLRAARELTEAKLPRRVRDTLALPTKERNRLIAQQRRKSAAGSRQR